MASVFSFIKHPILALLEISNQQISGLEKAMALYYDISSASLKCKEIINSGNEIIINDILIDDLSSAQKLRVRKFKAQWMATHNLPFETHKLDKKQLSIFDELNNVVLGLGFTNPYDNQSDLIFLYFNQNKGNFGVSKSTDRLTTDEKSIIGAIIHNSLQVFLQQQIADSETLRLVNQKVYKLEEENNGLRKQIEAISKNYNGSLIEMCQFHLKALSNSYGVTFQLANETVEKLQRFSGQMEELKQVLSDAATLALNLNFGQETSTIVLKPWDIIFKTKKISEKVDSTEIADRYLKTYSLLNKLESAAQRVATQNQALTSANVGNACPSPISAPAISDALKNHRKKLVSLMQEHPDKWLIIRNDFKPIKNILANA